MEGRDTAPPGSESQSDRFYGVAVGVVPGIYTDWPTAQRQIAGVKGPKYKKFATRAEAAEFVKANSKGGVSPPLNTTDSVNVIRPVSYESNVISQEPLPKSRRTDAGDTSVNIFQSKVASSNAGALRVYTDGSALGNGKNGASAGVGVFFGVGDPRYVQTKSWPRTFFTLRSGVFLLESAIFFIFFASNCFPLFCKEKTTRYFATKPSIETSQSH